MTPRSIPPATCFSRSKTCKFAQPCIPLALMMGNRAVVLLFVALVQLGCCIRHRDDAQEEGAAVHLKSDSNSTSGTCCCYRPVGSKVYTNPFGDECPVKGAIFPKSERGCFRPAKASPCDVGPNKYDMYCQKYYMLACDTRLTSPDSIMWNKPWQRDYDRM